MTAPKSSGIYLDVPDSTYHSWDLCSSTRLNLLASRTPLHVNHAVNFPEAWDSPAKQLGRAVHCLVLEPKKWPGRFAQAPECDRRTKEGKQLWADFCTLNEGREVIKADVGQAAQEMALAVQSNKDAAALLRKAEVREVSIVTELWGVRFKARLDAHGENLICDLKTTRCASESEFERSIMNYGYGLQAAAYMRAAASVGLTPKHFAFICVENEAPHAVAVYRLKNDVIDLFDERLHPLVKSYGECVKARSWPGYPDGIREIGVPMWYQRRMENGEVAA